MALALLSALLARDRMTKLFSLTLLDEVQYPSATFSAAPSVERGLC